MNVHNNIDNTTIHTYYIGRIDAASSCMLLFEKSCRLLQVVLWRTFIPCDYLSGWGEILIFLSHTCCFKLVDTDNSQYVSQ
jgi:hypothetical protein